MECVKQTKLKIDVLTKNERGDSIGDCLGGSTKKDVYMNITTLHRYNISSIVLKNMYILLAKHFKYSKI